MYTKTQMFLSADDTCSFFSRRLSAERKRLEAAREVPRGPFPVQPIEKPNEHPQSGEYAPVPQCPVCERVDPRVVVASRFRDIPLAMVFHDAYPFIDHRAYDVECLHCTKTFRWHNTTRGSKKDAENTSVFVSREYLEAVIGGDA